MYLPYLRGIALDLRSRNRAFSEWRLYFTEFFLSYGLCFSLSKWKQVNPPWWVYLHGWSLCGWSVNWAA